MFSWETFYCVSKKCCPLLIVRCFIEINKTSWTYSIDRFLGSQRDRKALKHRSLPFGVLTIIMRIINSVDKRNILSKKSGPSLYAKLLYRIKWVKTSWTYSIIRQVFIYVTSILCYRDLMIPDTKR